MDIDKRESLGAFYTPELVADEMVSWLGEPSNKAKIWEPSGGDGSFVRALLRAGWKPKNITVWDINLGIVGDLQKLGVEYKICDTLQSWPQNSPKTASDGSLRGEKSKNRPHLALASTPPQFPISPAFVIGNPPYLSKDSAYIKANRESLKEVYSEIGAHDTYTMFLYRAFQELAPGGTLIFLISDTFLSLLAFILNFVNGSYLMPL
jgi:hypothetical protein